MKFFTRNKISEQFEEAADKLKQARRQKKLSLDQVAKTINISAKYLEAIEKNQLKKLPAGLYGKNFIREYANFLGVDAKEVIELFGLSNGHSHNGTSDIFAQKIPGNKYFISLPKIITAVTITCLVIACIGYLGFRLKNIISPPILTITNPMSDLTIEKNYIDIQGLTEPEAEVTINGEIVLTDPAGFFIKKVSLKSGLNTISIAAQKKYSRKNLIEKKILVKS